MAEIPWRQIAKKKVPANPTTGVWTNIVDYIQGPRRLKFTAQGNWMFAKGSKQTTADGDLSVTANPNAMIVAAAPIGSLVGKIGGSTAGKADGTTYVIGSYCVLDLTEAKGGAPFLTVNDEAVALANNQGEIEVTIYDAPL